MEKSPVLKIDGKRYIARCLKMGAYRQIMLLIDEIDGMDPEELKDEMLEALRRTYDLTTEQAERIDAADLMPTFRAVAIWSRSVFTSKVEQIPNENSPQTTPGA